MYCVIYFYWNSKWALIRSPVSRWHSVVRVAGFKPVGAEKRSGSIPPSGRRFCPRPGVRTSYALLQVFNTYFWKVGGYRRILEKVSQVSAIEVARDRESDVGSNDESSYIYTTHSRRHSSSQPSSALLDSATFIQFTRLRSSSSRGLM